MLGDLRKGTALVAVTALLCGGCMVEAGPDPVDRVAWLAMRASEVRELDYLRAVPVFAMSPDAYDRAQDARAEDIDDAELQEFAETWGRLGYFPVDADLRPAIADSRDWVGGFYSSDDDGSITLIGPASDALIVHEHVHALQDQHFDLEAYQSIEPSDGHLARRAAAEGDAELASARYYAQEQGADLEDLTWKLEVARDQSEQVLDEAELPLFAADRSFVYYYGLEYCLANLTGYSFDAPSYTRPVPFDWSREDRLFAERPPISTWQVLRHEATPPEGTETIGLAEVPADLGDTLETVGWDSLGSWYTYVLLQPLDGDAEELRALVQSWRGDRVLFVRATGEGAFGLAWTSVWSDEDAAIGFADAWRDLHGASLDDPLSPFSGVAADGEPVWIERRAEQVVVLKNVAADLAPALAEAAFQGAPPADSDEPARDDSASPAQRRLAPWLKRLTRHHE